MQLRTVYDCVIDFPLACLLGLMIVVVQEQGNDLLQEFTFILTCSHFVINIFLETLLWEVCIQVIF